MHSDDEPIPRGRNDIPASWLAMGTQKLQRYLTDRRYPTPIIKDMVARIRTIKAERRAQRIKATVIYNLWDEFLQPLRTELATVRTMKSQAKREIVGDFVSDGLQARFDALEAYDTLLASLVAEFKDVQKADKLTPQQTAKRAQKAGLLPPHVDGSHWTDYVPSADKRRIAALFAAMPQPRRGKPKTLFERKISPVAHERQRTELARLIAIETASLEQQYEMTSDTFEREALDKRLYEVREAAYRLEMLSRTSPLPTTWHGLLKG